MDMLVDWFTVNFIYSIASYSSKTIILLKIMLTELVISYTSGDSYYGSKLETVTCDIRLITCEL